MWLIVLVPFGVLVSWILAEAMRPRKPQRRETLRIRDQLTPEEQAVRFDKLMRKRSAELKAQHDEP